MKKVPLRNLHVYLAACNSGVALIEFAISLPLLLIMFTGMLELAYYTILHEKLDKIANAMADYVVQGPTVSATDLNNFAVSVPDIMRPFTFNGSVIFSSVISRATGGGIAPTPPCLNFGPCVSWQQNVLGAGASKIGHPGGPASLPSGYVVLQGQNVIVAEASINYSPLLSSSANFVPAFTPGVIYKIAVLKPRQGSLTSLGR